MLNLTVFSFFEVIPILFQAIQNHHVDQCASEVSQLKEIIHYLSALIYRANFFIKPITDIGRYQYGGRYIVHPYFKIKLFRLSTSTRLPALMVDQLYKERLLVNRCEK